MKSTDDEVQVGEMMKATGRQGGSLPPYDGEKRCVDSLVWGVRGIGDWEAEGLRRGCRGTSLRAGGEGGVGCSLGELKAGGIRCSAQNGALKLWGRPWTECPDSAEALGGAPGGADGGADDADSSAADVS